MRYKDEDEKRWRIESEERNECRAESSNRLVCTEITYNAECVNDSDSWMGKIEEIIFIH